MNLAKSHISRLLVLLAVVGILVSPLTALTSSSVVLGEKFCMKTMQVCESDQPAVPVKVKACCAKHLAETAPTKSTTPAAEHESAPAPCGDSSHCACCLTVCVSLCVTELPPLNAALELSDGTVVRPMVEQCVLSDWHDRLLRPPIV